MPKSHKQKLWENICVIFKLHFVNYLICDKLKFIKKIITF